MRCRGYVPLRGAFWFWGYLRGLPTPDPAPLISPPGGLTYLPGGFLGLHNSVYCPLPADTFRYHTENIITYTVIIMLSVWIISFNINYRRLSRLIARSVRLPQTLVRVSRTPGVFGLRALYATGLVLHFLIYQHIYDDISYIIYLLRFLIHRLYITVSHV